MPTIKIIDSVKVLIYFNDYSPPHFHAVYAEYEELFDIENLNSIAGELPINKRKKILKWATEHKDFLLKKWKEFDN